MFGLFNGVVRPYASLPTFWRYWMYYVNPSTYWIGGILSATLAGQPVECAPGETALFDVPPPSAAAGGGAINRTCAAYAGAFAETAGGYLLNPDALSGCEYCPYRSGDDFLRTLNITPDEKWRGQSIPIQAPPIYARPPKNFQADLFLFFFPQTLASSSRSASPTGRSSTSSSTRCACGGGASASATCSAAWAGPSIPSRRALLGRRRHRRS